MKSISKLWLWLLLVFLALPAYAQAAPKLANYYLGSFDTSNYDQLARYDLLVIQPEAVYYNRAFFDYYRYRRPEGRLLAYLYPAQFYMTSLWYDNFGSRQLIYRKIDKNDWWLRDADGDIVQSWPGMNVVNLTESEWRNYALAEYDRLYDLSLWDGVMYDMVDSRASLYNRDGVDIDDDGLPETDAIVDWQWQNAMIDMLRQTRQRLSGSNLLVINGNSLYTYQQDINGRIFESFPTPWEEDGSWSGLMRQCLKRLPSMNQEPNTYVLNTAYQPDDDRDYFEQMRFGLTSTMLGDGYHSFDAGPESHAEMWWFDEYEYDLGKPEGEAYMPYSPGIFADGLWRRDYEKGLVLVNSGKSSVRYDLGGEYQKIKGIQQPSVNSGMAATSVCLGPQQGIMLLSADYKQPLLYGDYLTSYSSDSGISQPGWWQNISWLKTPFVWLWQIFVLMANASVELVMSLLFYLNLFLQFIFPIVI